MTTPLQRFVVQHRSEHIAVQIAKDAKAFWTPESRHSSSAYPDRIARS